MSTEDLPVYEPTGEVWVQHARRGDDGVSTTELAKHLDCTRGVLKRVLNELGEDPVGWGMMIESEYPLFDKALAQTLVSHPLVVESRRRRHAIVTPRKREGFLSSLASTWNFQLAELIAVTVGPYKSLEHLTVPLGACTVLMGPNGSGKTNILEAIAFGCGNAALVDRLRPRGSPKTGTGGQPDASSISWYLRLPRSDAQALSRFLNDFVRGKGTEDPYGSTLRQILTVFLEHPVLAISWDSNYGRYNRMGLSTPSNLWLAAEGPALAEAAALAKEIQALAGPKDPWIQALLGSVQVDANTPRPLSPLTHEPQLTRPHVDIVDGDPSRLIEDIVATIPDLAEQLWSEHVIRLDGRPLVIDLALEEPAAGSRQWDIDDPSKCPWVAWLTAPSSDDNDADALVQRCKNLDPTLSLGTPSAGSSWLAAGTGPETLESIHEAAPIRDRQTVRDLLTRASGAYLKWLFYEASDKDEWATLEESTPAKRFIRTLDGLFVGLGYARSTTSVTHEAHWLTSGSGGAVIPSTIRATIGLVEQLANEIAPPFVQHQGRILLSAYPPEQWVETESIMQIRFVDSGSRLLNLAETGRGAQRWIAAAIRESLRRLRGSRLRLMSDSGVSRDDTPAQLMGSVQIDRSQPELSLLLVDEPEMSLHVEAQEQAGEWCVAASRMGQSVVVATHSPAMLELSPADADVVSVAMTKGSTRVAPIEMSDLAGLDEIAKAVGLGRSQLLQLTKGFIIVEGPSDAEVLKTLLDADLKRFRLVPIPLHGVFRYRGMVQPEFLAALGKPIVIMFDEIRREMIDGSRPPESDEEKVLKRLIVDFKSRFPDVSAISFDAPDVICALPEVAVRRQFPTFAGWAPLLAQWDPELSNFKSFALDSLGLQPDQAHDLIRRTLDAHSPTDILPPAFARTASELRAWAGSLRPGFETFSS